MDKNEKYNMDFSYFQDERCNRGLLPDGESIEVVGKFHHVVPEKNSVLMKECVANIYGTRCGIGHMYWTMAKKLKKEYKKGDIVRVKGRVREYKHKKEMEYNEISRGIDIIEDIT